MTKDYIKRQFSNFYNEVIKGNYVNSKLNFVETPFTKIGGQSRNQYNNVSTNLNVNSWFTTEAIEIKQGDTVKWTASGYRIQTAMIATCDENTDNAIVRVVSIQNPDSSKSYYTYDYMYRAPKDCYVTLSGYIASGQSEPKLYIAKASKAIENENDVLHIVNTNEVNREMCHIFKKVVCIGDSYTKGLIKNPESGVLLDVPEYSWVEHMKNKTGNEWINRGISGATVSSWLTNENGLAKVVSDGKSQAYIVGLGINDSKVTNGSTRTPIGTSADIGTEAETYYGKMSKIITSLAEISPNAVIFINTCPWDIHADNPAEADRLALYNTAVRDIVEHYKATLNIHCLDLADKYASFFEPYEFQRFQGSAHPTAEGHARLANIMEYCLSDYMHDNATSFNNVPWIEYDA